MKVSALIMLFCFFTSLTSAQLNIVDINGNNITSATKNVTLTIKVIDLNRTPVYKAFISFILNKGTPIFNETNEQGLAKYVPQLTGNLLIIAEKNSAKTQKEISVVERVEPTPSPPHRHGGGGGGSGGGIYRSPLPKNVTKPAKNLTKIAITPTMTTIKPRPAIELTPAITSEQPVNVTQQKIKKTSLIPLIIMVLSVIVIFILCAYLYRDQISEWLKKIRKV